MYHANVAAVTTDVEVKEALEEYFDIDRIVLEAPAHVTLSEEDKRAIEIMETTTKKVGDRYETGLLWKTDHPELPNSYGQAISRLASMDKKFLKDKDLHKWYQAKITEYVSKGYAYKMSPERVACPLGHIFYLPHFVTANRAGKRRIVFDAAAKSRGVSLNCQLLRGPKDLQPRPLIHKLMHFRQSRIGVRADIKEMFHRVRIINKDQDALRFVWRDSEADPLLPPDVYAMDAMIFGARCSPCSSQHAKNLNALRFAGEHPRAVEAIVK